jgi:hypothetical protein
MLVNGQERVSLYLPRLNLLVDAKVIDGIYVQAFSVNHFSHGASSIFHCESTLERFLAMMIDFTVHSNKAYNLTHKEKDLPANPSVF